MDARSEYLVDPAIEQRQVERLQQVKKERNGKAVREALEYVREVAQGEENLVPACLEAVRAYGTVGEICDALRGVFGEYQAKEYFSAKGS